MRKPDYASGPETPDFSPGSGFIAEIQLAGGVRSENMIVLIVIAA